MSRNTCVRGPAWLAAALCMRLWVPGISQGLEFTVRGELQSGTPRVYSEYTVQLVDRSNRNTLSKVEVRSDGSFEVRNVPLGEYNAVVTTLYGDEVCEQSVTIAARSDSVTVRMPDAPLKPRGGRTISVRQLMNPPSKKAFRSFMTAQKFSASGDYAKAAEALQHAVTESPDYAEARVNLSVQYMRTGHYPEAMTELKRAMEITGPTSLTLCNLAWLQMRIGERGQAIDTARAGLRLDQGSPQGNLILGSLLAEDPRTREEAIVHLEKAADRFASAKELLAKLKARYR